MKQAVVAAIVAAVNTYMEQEQAFSSTAPVRPVAVAVPSSWRAFGRHEAVRTRIHWHVRRYR